MANKKVSQLTSKPSVLTTDLFPIADPSTGQLFKTTISDLGTAIGSGVSSVNTLVGAVVLDTDDIQELASPTNKWFTDTRARAALSASSPLTYNSGTGAFGIQVATGSQNGYLSSTDWTTFNNKQNALTNPVTGTGATDRLVIWAGTNSVTSSANLFYSVVSGKHAINFGTAFNFISYADNGLGSNLDLVISADDSIKFYTTNFSSLAAKINDGGNFDIYTSLVVSNNITGASIIKSGGTSAQFLKADGSVDSSTYLTTGTAASTYLPLAGGTMTGNLFLPANNTVGGTNYYIGQTMASNDFWRIYGNTVAADQGEMIFELGDNGAPLGSNGQRFRFYYDANVGGTAKSPLTIDYNTISIEAFATITINQNAQTNLIIRNTTAGTSSIASTSLISDTSAGLGEIGKYSSTTTAYKITTPSSTYLYNGTAGNIAIQNDFASGSIVMAAGGSSTAHFTIAPTGATSFSSSISVPKQRIGPVKRAN